MDLSVSPPFLSWAGLFPVRIRCKTLSIVRKKGLIITLSLAEVAQQPGCNEQDQGECRRGRDKAGTAFGAPWQRCDTHAGESSGRASKHHNCSLAGICQVLDTAALGRCRSHRYGSRVGARGVGCAKYQE